MVWHTLRHEFVNRTLENTNDVNTARDLARHKDVRTTDGYMSARRPHLLRAAALAGRR
jgi:site-specific recombinase XerD